MYTTLFKNDQGSKKCFTHIRQHGSAQIQKLAKVAVNPQRPLADTNRELPRLAHPRPHAHIMNMHVAADVAACSS